MVFRITARIGAILIFVAGIAQTQTFNVMHKHLHGDAPGTLLVTDTGITFIEKGKHANHSRTWKYEQVQQFELSEDKLSIQTYEDQKWQPGRDRNYLFTHLPAAFAKSVYPVWRDQLDQRFVAALAGQPPAALSEFPAKLTGVLKGVEGTLFFADDQITFRAAKPGESRTWRFTDIDNIASAGPFDLSIVTYEHHGREFRFQLQRPMEEARFNELWRKVVRKTINESSGSSGSYNPSRDTALSYKE